MNKQGFNFFNFYMTQSDCDRDVQDQTIAQRVAPVFTRSAGSLTYCTLVRWQTVAHASPPPPLPRWLRAWWWVFLLAVRLHDSPWLCALLLWPPSVPHAWLLFYFATVYFIIFYANIVCNQMMFSATGIASPNFWGSHMPYGGWARVQKCPETARFWLNLRLHAESN